MQKLYTQADKCKFCKTEKNKLQHIHGYGVVNPRLMLVLINPTYRNLSSSPEYHGDRFPFIGVRQFWKVLADGGLVSKKVAYGLPPRADWTLRHTKQLQRELMRGKLFLTNAVKCCYSHSAYPDTKVIHHQMKLLAEEINIVKPKKIVAFGGLVYKTLTGKPLKLSECWSGKQTEEAERISGLRVRVAPCYFPIGRGNPRKAAEILRRSFKL